jgi:hypothetical protein
VLLAACADGAGSAEMAELGAALAVDTFLACADDALTNQSLDPAHIDEDVLRSWNVAAREQIEKVAKERGVTPRQLACTLLTAIVGPSSAAFSQIGDGVVVIDGADGYEHVFWPESGEFVNETCFVTDAAFPDAVRFQLVDREIRDLAILSDGLQMLALNYAEKGVYSPFFEPLFAALRTVASGETVKPSLDAFLDSERVNERTDDDKTLLLATRRVAPADEPSPDVPEILPPSRGEDFK